jgi:vacuolar-type H+-ATPase subunit H
MAENLIQQVKSLEAEADALVAKARTAARQIEQTAAGEATALREQFEEKHRRDLAVFRTEQEQRVAREQADLDARARKIADALQSVAPEAAEKAVGLVLRHLREG